MSDSRSHPQVEHVRANFGARWWRAGANSEPVRGYTSPEWFISLCLSLIVPLKTVWCIAFYSDWGFHCLPTLMILHRSYGTAQVLSGCPLFHTSAVSVPSVSKAWCEYFGWLMYYNSQRQKAHCTIGRTWNMIYLLWAEDQRIACHSRSCILSTCGRKLHLCRISYLMCIRPR